MVLGRSMTWGSDLNPSRVAVELKVARCSVKV